MASRSWRAGGGPIARLWATALVAAIGLLVAACGPAAPTAPAVLTGTAAAARLEGALPPSVEGIQLETQDVTARQLPGTTGFEELVARLARVARTPDDLVGATAIDPTGASDLRIVAIRLIGEDAGGLRSIVLAWAHSLDGATVGPATLGRPVTAVRRPDQPTVAYFVDGDPAFLVSASDAALARAALDALP